MRYGPAPHRSPTGPYAAMALGPSSSLKRASCGTGDRHVQPPLSGGCCWILEILLIPSRGRQLMSWLLMVGSKVGLSLEELLCPKNLVGKLRRTGIGHRLGIQIPAVTHGTGVW